MHTQRGLEGLLAKAFVSGNIPWNFIKNPFFGRFIHQLRPNFDLKSRKTLSNTILDRVCDTEDRLNDIVLHNELGTHCIGFVKTPSTIQAPVQKILRNLREPDHLTTK